MLGCDSLVRLTDLDPESTPATSRQVFRREELERIAAIVQRHPRVGALI